MSQHTPPDPADAAGPSGLFGRTRRLVGALRERRAERGRDATRPGGLVTALREGLAHPLDFPRHARALLRVLEGQIKDLADAAAGHLLSLDEAAAQLALFVEQARERHGYEAIIGLVLRKNLLLDGTILSFIEPVLRGKGLLAVEPAALERGRRTLIGLLVEVVALDAPPPEGLDDDPEAALAWLEAQGLDERCFALKPYLRGEVEDAQMATFLTNSYLLFLQSFMLRAAAHTLGELAQGHDPQGPTPAIDVDVD